MDLFVDTSDAVITPRGTEYGRYLENSIIGHMIRGGSNGIFKSSENRLQLPPATYNLQSIMFSGTVQVVNQFAVITAVGNMSNCTGVYTDVWDGTLAYPLNNTPGVDVSGALVGSYLATVGDPSVDLLFHNPDQVRVYAPNRKSPGYPFTVTAKQGVNNYLRINLTTTTNLDFTLFVVFEYQLLGPGASLTML